jgi:hypothetical protein
VGGHVLRLDQVGQQPAAALEELAEARPEHSAAAHGQTDARIGSCAPTVVKCHLKSGVAALRVGDERAIARKCKVIPDPGMVDLTSQLGALEHSNCLVGF